MKKWNLIFVGILLFSLTRMSAQEYYMTSPVGYGRAATGGGNATPVIVTTSSQLSSALTASGPGVILIQGAIQVDYLSVLATNKTLLGLPGSKLFTNVQTAGGSGILYFKAGTKNVIIRNVTFVGPGAYDSDGRDCLTFDGATDCWVDHCDFQDGMDGNFDNKGSSDNITISWCKFSYNKAPKAGGSGGTDDHRFTNLVGSNSSDFPKNTASDTQYSITWQNCWWAQGCVERMVRARNAQLHMLNCLWNSSVAKKCIGLEDGTNGKGTQCYIEGGVFETPSSTKNIDVSYGGTPDVTVVGSIGNGLANYSTAVAKPSYPYTALSSSQVKAALTSSCGAGATLNVTTAGVISSACNGETPVTPTLVLQSGSTSQSVTVNTAISNIVYSYGGTATGATVTGLPSGVSSAVNTTAKTVTISGTPTSVQTATYTVTTTQSSGTAVALSGTITTTAAVTPASLALTSGSTSQSVTVNTAISNIVYTYGGSATGATVTGLPSGVSATVNTTAKTVTISGTPTSVQTATYTVSTAGGSPTVTLNGTLTSTSVPVTTLAVPTSITASATQNSATINWGAVTNATGYTVNLCNGGGTSSNVVMLLNSTTATSTGVYTLNTGDQYKTTASISTSSACSPTGYTNTYRSGSINVNSLKLVNTTGVTKLTIGAKSSGSTVRNLVSYSINGVAQLTTGITQPGIATCGEYVINGLNLTAGQEIAFVFDGNVQISYFIASAGTASCTETAVTGTSFTATGLTANTSYTYQVKATNSNSGYVNSAYSTPATVTTSTTVTNGSLVLTTGSANQSIVLGNAIASIVYTYGGSATGATVTGLPSGVSSSVNTTAKTVTISGTPTSVESAAYTVTTTQSSGSAASLSGTITTTAAPATLVLTTGSTNQSIVLGSAIASIVYTYGGSATGATVTGLPSGVSSSVNTTAKTVTISGTPTSVESAAYTVTTTQSSGNAASLSGTITTTAAPATLVLTSGSTNQSIVLGSAIASIVYTYGGSATGTTVTGLPSGVSSLVDTTAKTVTISGTPTSVQTATYTVTTTQSSGSAVSLSGTITTTTPAPVTLAVPSNITASATSTSATISWDTVANATGYTVSLCSGSAATSSNKVLLFNSTAATTTGVYTLNTGDQYKSSASISTSGACAPAGYTNGFRSASTNVNALKLVNTTGVTSLAIGAKSSGSSARTLLSYSINGGAQITTGITQSGVATCGEYRINGLNLAAGNEIAFVFDGNIQISYFIATASTTGGVTCTETNVTGTSYTATGLTANTSYTYQVKATSTSSAYTNSAYSTAASVTTNSTARYAATKGSKTVATETENTSTSGFQCYPTLVENEVQISLPETGNATISVFDLSGRQVITVTANEKNTTLNLSSLTQGVYVVSASQNGNLMQQRIIKK